MQLRDSALAGHSVAYPWVSELSTRFGPRPAGSDNEHQAAQWAVARLKALGFDKVHLESFPITAWVRGSESGQITAPGRQPLTLAALGESPPTPAAGPQRGAIAYVLRSMGTDSHRLAHTGTTRYVNARVPIPCFALSNPDAHQIERLHALGETVRVRLISGAAYVQGARSQNVIAEVRGRGRAPRSGAARGAPGQLGPGDRAIDDGTGTAIIVAAAKLIRDLPQKPERTVRVVLFGSEEVAQPLPPDSAFGSHAYAERHRSELSAPTRRPRPRLTRAVLRRLRSPSPLPQARAP